MKVIKKSKNIGVDLLRFILCSLVIMLHLWETDYSTSTAKEILHFFVQSPVASFVFISFLLTGDKLLSNDKSFLKKRFERLVVPQVFFTIMYWIVFNFFFFVVKSPMRLSVYDFFLQLLTGHKFNASMWYQIDLIIVTFIFAMIIAAFPKYRINLIFLLGIAAIVLEYSNFNFELFHNLSTEFKYPLGRLTEIIPFAVAGFIFAYYRIPDKLKEHIILTIIGSICVLIAVLKFDIFTNVSGFNYQGIELLLSAVALVSFFYVLPLDKLPHLLTKAINYIGKYTLGIYCIHRLIDTLLDGLFGICNIACGTFPQCILVYIISYFCCMLLSKIPLKYIQMSVN